tara:strand:- start:4043 stop:4957 length:915 start_codon:yes stop_codon:yes gene_type:complete
MISLKLIKKNINRRNYISRSKKISQALKDVLKKPKIGIVDIGAGHRYLPTLLNFDGISKIAMVDPNKSLDWSYQNFKKIIKYPENLFKFKFGIGNKTSKKKYYIADTLTGSTFVDVYKIANKNQNKLDSEYFGKKKSNIKKIYSFKDFTKTFFKYKIDVVKIDVEGFEFKIIASLLKHSRPMLIEVETNMNSEVYPNTFDDINFSLKKKGYKLITAFPIFKKTKKNNINSSYDSGNYDNPISRLNLEQFECIYIKEKSEYNIKDLTILVGYGLSQEAKKILSKSKIKCTRSEKVKMNQILKNFF